MFSCSQDPCPMIDTLRVLSQKFLWLKTLFVFLSFASLCTITYVIFYVHGNSQDIYLMPSIVCLLWSLSWWLLLSCFPHVPPKSPPQQAFIVRLKNGIIRSVYYLAVLLFIVLSLLMVILTIKLLTVWYIEYSP